MQLHQTRQVDASGENTTSSRRSGNHQMARVKFRRRNGAAVGPWSCVNSSSKRFISSCHFRTATRDFGHRISTLRMFLWAWQKIQAFLKEKQEEGRQTEMKRPSVSGSAATSLTQPREIVLHQYRRIHAGSCLRQALLQ
jgi:hypothetical protein